MNIKEYLNSLLAGCWEKIVVQGGKLERSPSAVGYLLFGIWLYCQKRWIEISAIEYRYDEYWLSISIMDIVPIPEPSKVNNPPRQLLTTFPDDCRLDKLSTDGVEAVVSGDLERADGEILSKEPLILRSPSGDKFEVAASTKFPGNIEIISI